MKKRAAKRKGAFYALGQFLLRLFYYPVYRLKVIGKENIPKEGPVLLCSNHIAMKDPVLLGVVQPRQVFYIAKEELFRNKFICAVLRGLGAFPVRRGSGGADALADAYQLLDQNAMVGVFIEGTRSKTGELLKPKTGAALLRYRTGAPVVPVCITAEGGGCSRPFRRTEIRFGKPISPEIPDDSSMQLRRASRAIMAEITALRAESARSMGFALPAEAEQTPPQEKEGE